MGSHHVRVQEKKCSSQRNNSTNGELLLLRSFFVAFAQQWRIFKGISTNETAEWPANHHVYIGPPGQIIDLWPLAGFFNRISKLNKRSQLWPAEWRAHAELGDLLSEPSPLIDSLFFPPVKNSICISGADHFHFALLSNSCTFCFWFYFSKKAPPPLDFIYRTS